MIYLCIFFIYCNLSNNLSICITLSLYCNLIKIRFSVRSCIHKASSKRTRGSKVYIFNPPPQTNILLVKLLDFCTKDKSNTWLKWFCVPPSKYAKADRPYLKTHLQKTHTYKRRTATSMPQLLSLVKFW